MSKKEDNLRQYPSEARFSVVDTIPVDHYYCVGTKHVAYAADNHNGILSEAVIREVEKVRGVGLCEVCKERLEDHKEGLLVCVDSEQELKDVEGLEQYVKSLLPLADEHGYVGFAFIQKSVWEKANRRFEDEHILSTQDTDSVRIVSL